MQLSKKKELLVILTLASIQFIHIVDFMVMMPLGPQFIRVLGINAQQFSFLISAYTLSAGVFGFLASFILDKIDRKKSLLITMVGFGIGTLACALSDSYSLLMLSRIVTGAFGGVLAGLVLAIVGDIVPAERRGQAMGIVMTSFSFASIFGVPFGLFLANIFRWEVPFYFLVATTFIVWLIAYKMIPPIREHLKKEGEAKAPFAVVSALQDHNQRRALSLTMVLMFGQFSVIPLISTYMVTNVGFSEQNLTYIYILGGLASILTAPISGRLSDKFSYFPIFAIFSALVTIPLFGITHLGPQNMVLPLVVSTLLFISSSGRMVAGMSLIVSSVGPKQRGGFMSLNACIQQLSAGIAAFIAGLIVYQNEAGQLVHYSRVGYLAMTMAVLAILVASRIKSIDQPKSMTVVTEQEITETLL